MGKKQHANLSVAFEKKFPKLFDFEFCGLLLIDASNDCLYKIQDAEEAGYSSSDEENGANAEKNDDNPERIKTQPPSN